MLILFNFRVLHDFVLPVVFACNCTCIFEKCAYSMQLYLFLMNFTGTPSNLRFDSWQFQTAGFGVFAGRAFKQDELVLRSWMTLYLPRNLPRSQVVCNYIFGHNKTHAGLVLDYGSLLNHHESANTKTVQILGSAPNNNFQVRGGFQCANRNVRNTSMHAHIHNRYAYT